MLSIMELFFLIYRAKHWGKIIKVKETARLRIVQRGITSMAGVYRTVSAEVVLVIVGRSHLTLLLKRRRK